MSTEGINSGYLGSPMDPKPTNNVVKPLLTDMYQITMSYGYWCANRHEIPAVFDMFFRKNPFKGEFTIFAGLSQVLSFLNTYKFTKDQIDFLRTQMPLAEEGFFEWLATVDCSRVKVHAFREGSVCFPREPLLRVEGPIAVCQLLETTLLTLINYASLVATNAARIRIACGPEKTLLEMGLRRAQGPDGALSASRYAYIGGFDASSNVMAGMLFGMRVSGTHAHAFVQSFTSLQDLRSNEIKVPDKSRTVNFVEIVQKYLRELNFTNTNQGELAAFIAYCQAFPSSFLALVDTYDTLQSGTCNFLGCALALIELGYKPLGIRLDSGELSELSNTVRATFLKVEEKYKIEGFARSLNIVASNDLSEEALYRLKDEGHSIDTFGIGTHLVTCQSQPALGCVYKLVEMDGKPRIKLSQELVKVSVPGRKLLFRLFAKDGEALADVMMTEAEVAQKGEPQPGERIVCRHPMDESKRAVCVPHRITPLLQCVWDGRMMQPIEHISETRARVMSEMATFKKEIFARDEPFEYFVSLSETMYSDMHDLWMREAPMPELK